LEITVKLISTVLRDEAMKQTRRLQREILEERERVKALAV